MTTWLKLTLVISALGLLFGPGIQHHWQVARDPHFVPFDAVQYVPAFFKFSASDPIPTTFLKEYFLNAICPPLYKASLMVGAQFADVRSFQLVMMYAAYLIFVAVMGRVGWLLGGALLSFAVMAFTISAWIYIGLGFIGGAPRMYGYPLMALILCALVSDRPRVLGLAAILGALLYPVIAVIAGLCLTGWMLVPLYSNHGVVSAWTLRRRLVTLIAAGILSVMSLVPLLLGSGTYDRRIVAADIDAYPEAGADGNYRAYDQLPYQLFGREWLTYYLGPLYSHGDALAPPLNMHRNLDAASQLNGMIAVGLVVLVVSIAGLRRVLRGPWRAAGLRVIGLLIACAGLHVVSWLAAPYFYIPTRYFMFSLPFVVTFLFPWSIYSLVETNSRLGHSAKLPGAMFLTLAAIYLAAFGGRGNVDFDKGSMVAKPVRPLFDAIAALPKTSLIAGWPWGEMKNIEYATRRNVFLTAELHQVLHLGFVDAMRERMDACFEAYFAVDAAPLRRLRDRFGVTHFLVETHHFTDPKTPPEYFAPWSTRIAPRLAAVRGNPYIMNESLHRSAALFNGNGLILLDLARLP